MTEYYGFSRQVDLNFKDAIEKVKEELKKEGFGIISEINVAENLREKLKIEMEDYIILGACNPDFAYEALQNEKEIGLLLPCNIIVYSQDGKTFVSAINPQEAMSMVDNEKLKEIAPKVSKILKNVIDSL